MLDMGLQLALQPITVYRLTLGSVFVETVGRRPPINMLGRRQRAVESAVSSEGGCEGLDVFPLELHKVVATCRKIELEWWLGGRARLAGGQMIHQLLERHPLFIFAVASSPLSGFVFQVNLYILFLFRRMVSQVCWLVGFPAGFSRSSE